MEKYKVIEKSKHRPLGSFKPKKRGLFIRSDRELIDGILCIFGALIISLMVFECFIG